MWDPAPEKRDRVAPGLLAPNMQAHSISAWSKKLEEASPRQLISIKKSPVAHQLRAKLQVVVLPSIRSSRQILRTAFF